MVTRARVGDLVVWENLLDREVEIMGGAYDYKGAPAVELSRFTAQPDNSDQLDDRGIDTFLAVHPLPTLSNPIIFFFFFLSLFFFVLSRSTRRRCGSKTAWKWPWIPLVTDTDRRQTPQRSTSAAGPPLRLPCRRTTTPTPSCPPAGPSTHTPLFFYY
jgi:hypothetical protein